MTINGLDISTWQENPYFNQFIDWPALKADPRNFRYIWIKAADGSNPADYPVEIPRRQLAGAQSVGFEAINFYHFYYYQYFDVAAGAWKEIPASSLAANFHNACNATGYECAHPLTDCEDPLVGKFLDFWDTTSANKALAFARRLNNHLKNYHAEVTRIFGVKPDIYTGAWWWDRFGKQVLFYFPLEAAWWKEYKFVLADYDGELNYPEGITPDQVIAWQKTSTPVPPVSGIPTGHKVPGDALDCEIWMQSEAAYYEWAGFVQPVLTLEQKVGRLWGAHTELW